MHTAVALSARPGLDVDVVCGGERHQPGTLTRWRDQVERAYGVDLGRVTLHAIRPRVDSRRLVGTLTGHRAEGPQAWSDVLVAPGIAAHLRAHRPDVSVTRRWPLVIASRRARVPVVFETHSPSWARLLGSLAGRLRCHGIVTHSELVRRVFLDSGVPADMVAGIPNGFDPARFEPALDRDAARRRLGLDGRAPIACYAGRLNARKCPESLMQTASHLPGVTVLLVGAMDDREQRRLEDLAIRHGASNVAVIPRVPAADVPTYLFAADVLLLAPSSAPLASGRTVLPLKTFAYLAAGRPIVAPATADVREVLEDGRNSCLVPADDPVRAAAAIRTVLARPDLAMQLAGQARLDARRFTWAARAARLEDFLRQRLETVPRSGIGSAGFVGSGFSRIRGIRL